MPYIQFDPSEVTPRLLRDREQECRSLRDQLTGYLDRIRRNTAPPLSRSACLVQGEKGSGKSIVVRKVLYDLRADWSDSTLFLEVDCRNLESVRFVIQRIALAVQEQLDSFTSVDELPKGLKAHADLLVEISGYDVVEFKTAQENMTRYRAAAELRGGSQFLKFLGSSFGLSVERQSTSTVTYAGKLRFDIQRLSKLLEHFFRDIREAGYSIVLWLDNIDELRHQYITEQERATVRDEAKWVLGLHEAPIALVACMRSYFTTGILPRAITPRYALEPLPPQILKELLDARLADEDESVRESLAKDPFPGYLDELSKLAPTPLAFLTWCHWIATFADMKGTDLRGHAANWYRNNFAGLDSGALAALKKCFGQDMAKAASHRISREDLLEALNKSELRLNHLIQCQAVLPVDFWNPIEFTLDPTLVWAMA